jgi:hypothetical protein
MPRIVEAPVNADDLAYVQSEVGVRKAIEYHNAAAERLARRQELNARADALRTRRNVITGIRL